MESADAGQWASTGGDRKSYHDFVGARRIVDAHFHAIKMTAHEGCVFVADGNIEHHSKTATLLRRGYKGSPLAQHLAKWCPELRVKDRCRMLEFAILAHDCGLAITLHIAAWNSE